MSAEKKNVWEIVVSELNKNGINAYPPATKQGQCKEKYVVVKSGGSTRANTYSSRRNIYNIFLYVPKNEYSTLLDFQAEVEEVMAKEPIYPMLMPTGNSENDYYDDNIDAHLRIISYYNNQRVKHL